MPPKFTVIRDEVEAARRELGIRDPVLVRITRYEYFEGRYIAHRDGQHRIGVDGRLSVKRASRTLWHELVHVRQSEELGGEKEFDREWRRQRKEAGLKAKDVEKLFGVRKKYERMPLEREAEQIARAHDDHQLVVKRPAPRPRRRRVRAGAAR